MKKLLLVVVVASTMILALSGCQSAKQVAYFQNIDSLNLSASRMLYDAKIMPKDQLSIIVKAVNENLVKSKIQPYFKDGEVPTVTVRMASFRVVVTGEVGSPGVVTVPNEKMSIVEALAQSGDLGLQGKRKNILLIREDATGKKEAHRLDMTDANLINSPYFYLQQNDIVYVEPNGAKKGTAGLSNSVTFWIGLVSSILSLATLTVSLCK